MNSEKELVEIRGRTEFYNKKEVGKFLLAKGVPRTKQEMLALIALEDAGTSQGAIQGDQSYLRMVSFEVHPQQINVRDKANGMLISSIAR